MKYESQARAIAKYDAQAYDRITIKARKGTKDEIKALAAAAGVSVNRYILEALEQKSGLKLTLDNALPWLDCGEK